VTIRAITTTVLTSHYCTVRSLHESLPAAQRSARAYVQRTGILHAQCAALPLSPHDSAEGTVSPHVGQTLTVARLGSSMVALRPLEGDP
jgi:hypothetical protein